MTNQPCFALTGRASEQLNEVLETLADKEREGGA